MVTRHDAANPLYKPATYRTASGSRYVRLKEIPEPHRSEFMRYLRGAGIPVIKGEGPLAYETDWLDWVYQRREDRR